MSQNTTDIQKMYAEKIKSLREKEGLKQGQFAKKIGYKASFVSDLENNRRAITEKTLSRIAGFFKLPYNWYMLDISSFIIPKNPNWKYCPHCGEALQ